MRISLNRRDTFVPVSESGDRWAKRTLSEALAVMESYPAGGTYLDGEPWDGIAHVERLTTYRLTLTRKPKVL